MSLFHWFVLLFFSPQNDVGYAYNTFNAWIFKCTQWGNCLSVRMHFCFKWLMPIVYSFRLALLCLRCLWCWIPFPPSSSSSHSPNLPNNCAIYLGEDLLFLLLVLRVHRDVVLLPLTVPELDLDAASLPAPCPLLLFRPHIISISPSSLSEIPQLSREITTKYREACTLGFILSSVLE